MKISTLVLILACQQVLRLDSNPEETCPPELQSTIRAYERALGQKDAKAITGLLAENFQIITATGKILRKTDMLANLGKKETQYDSFDSTGVRYHKLGNTVVESGKVRTRGIRNGKPIDETTLYTDVWVYHEEKWKLLTEHSSFPSP